jgi:hypothetical protein
MKIYKIVVRSVSDNKKGLLQAPDTFLGLSLMAFIVILGIETYYRNILGEPGTIYITGNLD